MHRKRLLVIEDEERMVEIFEELFKPRGLDVFKGVRGPMCTDLAGAVRPDVIILSLGEPAIDGLCTIRELKEKLPDTNIIVFSGWIGEETKYQAFLNGADMYMVKPGDMDILKEKVFQLLAKGS